MTCFLFFILLFFAVGLFQKDKAAGGGEFACTCVGVRSPDSAGCPKEGVGWVFRRKRLINSFKQWRKGLVRESWRGWSESHQFNFVQSSAVITVAGRHSWGCGWRAGEPEAPLSLSSNRVLYVCVCARAHMGVHLCWFSPGHVLRTNQWCWSPWKTCHFCPATGIPSDLMRDVTGEAGGRRKQSAARESQWRMSVCQEGRLFLISSTSLWSLAVLCAELKAPWLFRSLFCTFTSLYCVWGTCFHLLTSTWRCHHCCFYLN